MTDLVTLIKTAIENVPQKDGNGRLDTIAMARAAAVVAMKEAANEINSMSWTLPYYKSPELNNVTDDVAEYIRDLAVEQIKYLTPKPSE